MRKHYSTLFKAQLVQKMLREEKTLTQLSSDHGVHVNQLREWRQTALEGLPSLFERGEATATLKAAQRQMQEMGIAGIAPGPHLSTRAVRHPLYPYLLRDLASAWPNHVWGIDITYIRMEAGWLYLVAVLDWYSRYVVSWELDLTL